MRTLTQEFTKGLWEQIPPFRLVLGLCPTLAVTKSLEGGWGMGLATTFVLVMSNLIISIIRGIVPPKVRIATFIVVIATFVVITELVMAAYTPMLSDTLGVFIPLIVVNCIILGRAEAFASRNSILRSALDGVGMSLGFTVTLFVLGAIREITGSGTLTLFQMGENVVRFDLLGEGYIGTLVMILPPGAFLTLGFLLAFRNAVQRKLEQKKTN